MLPDVLAEGLGIVFCGTAVGNISAQRQAYYAGPGNKFWRVLFETGLTDRLFQPSEYSILPKLGIGLTDLVKKRSGVDDDLIDLDFDVDSFKTKIERYEPGIVCFNGKNASKNFFNVSWVDYGLSNYVLGPTRFFTAPSTSGAANSYWDISYWKDVARLVKSFV